MFAPGIFVEQGNDSDAAVLKPLEEAFR